MQQTFTFTRRDGRAIRATLNVADDLRNIAFQLTNRAIRKNLTTVKALEGEITLTLEEADAA